MTALPALSFAPMDHSNHDEHMDFGSDMPAPNADFDFDLPDASRAASAEPIQDIMIEDVEEVIDTSGGGDKSKKDVADDDMIDEDLVGNEVQTIDESMENYEEDGQNSATMYDDEDLIYEDEDIVTRTEEGPADVEFEETAELADEAAAQVDEPQPVQQHVQESDANDHEDGTQYPSDYISAQQPEINEHDVEQGSESHGLEQNSQPLPSTPQANDDLLAAAGHIESHPKKADSEPVTAEQFIMPESNLTNEENDEDENNVSAAAGVADTSDQDESGSNTETLDDYDTQGLHPVMVQYDGTELCLFPPVEGDDTFFVQDSSLAFSSCHLLLAACREVLGESVRSDHELVLDFPSLGLHLTEGSSHASDLTIAQILDVYLALCQNEQIETVPPLRCTLRTRISLASQYAFLLSASENGKTLKEVRLESQERVKNFGVEPDVAVMDPRESGVSATESRLDSENDPSEVDGNKLAGRDVATEHLTPVVETSAEEPTENDELIPTQDHDDDAFDAKSEISSELDLGTEGDDTESTTLPHEQSDHDDLDDTSADAADAPVQGNETNGNTHIDLTPNAAQVVQPISEEALNIKSDGISVNDFAFKANTSETRGDDKTNDDDSNSVPQAALDNEEYVPYDEPSIPEQINGSEADETALVFEEPEQDDGEFISDPVLKVLQGTEAPEESNGLVSNTPSTSAGESTTQKPGIDDVTIISPANEDPTEILGSADEDDLLDLTEEAVPKILAAKRKLQDEDDYGLIEPATPEKKKRRPS